VEVVERMAENGTGELATPVAILTLQAAKERRRRDIARPAAQRYECRARDARGVRATIALRTALAMRSGVCPHSVVLHLAAEANVVHPRRGIDTLKVGAHIRGVRTVLSRERVACDPRQCAALCLRALALEVPHHAAAASEPTLEPNRKRGDPLLERSLARLRFDAQLRVRRGARALGVLLELRRETRRHGERQRTHRIE
jgi:hypothetical protein